MDAIGYIRISKKDQSTHSLSYQERSIREYCDRNHLALGSLFIDDGESSYTFDRPDFVALEKFIRQHKKKVKYLVVFDHDRFSRNLPEALQKIESLEKKHGLKVIATSEPVDIDTSDPSVFMLRAFKYLIANQELFTIRKRAKETAHYAQDSGRYINAAPYGYVNGKDAQGKNLLKIDDDENKVFIVRKIYNDFIAGTPKNIIHQEVRKLGFPHSANSAVFRILNNPLYAGLVRVCAFGKQPEKIKKGIHEAIVPEWQYYRVQELLDSNKRRMKTKPKDEFPLKGILKSPCCGTNLTAGWSKGKSKYYLYYRCIYHSNVNIPGAMLYEKFEELLKHLSLKQHVVDEIVEVVSKNVRNNVKASESMYRNIKSQLIAVETKREGIDNKLFDGVINDDTYKKWTLKLNAEKAKLKEELEYLDRMNDEIEQNLLVLPYMLNLHKVYMDSPLSQQHALAREVFKGGLTFSEGMFRTPMINEGLNCNSQAIKEKGLLFIEQPSEISSEIPYCGE